MRALAGTGTKAQVAGTFAHSHGPANDHQPGQNHLPVRTPETTGVIYPREAVRTDGKEHGRRRKGTSTPIFQGSLMVVDG